MDTYGEEENISRFNPVGHYITALGRVKLYKHIEKIIALGGKVFYGDTDSIKFWLPKNTSMDSLEIGAKLGE